MLRLGAEQAEKERTAVERRRAMEEERKQRVFNAKSRQKGVDKEALDAQIALKKQLEAEEKEREKAFDQHALLMDKMMQEQEEEAARMRKAEAEKLKEFWLIKQQKQNTRDYDLIDPKAKLKEAPARADDDDDATCGPASLQKFEGEDASVYARRTAQRAQQLEWAKQQMAERQAQINAERDEERQYQLQQIELANRAMEMEAAQQKAARDLARATAEYNLALAAERKEREKEEAIEEFQDKMEEMQNQLASDLLTENPDRVIGVTGKKNVQQFKGMSPAEIAAIKEEQRRQIEEKDRLKRQEREEEQAWDRYQMALTRAQNKQEYEVRQLEAAERKQNLQTLQAQADEKKRRDAKLRDENTNRPNDDFFKQFGTSSR